MPQHWRNCGHCDASPGEVVAQAVAAPVVHDQDFVFRTVSRVEFPGRTPGEGRAAASQPRCRRAAQGRAWRPSGRHGGVLHREVNVEWETKMRQWSVVGGQWSVWNEPGRVGREKPVGWVERSEPHRFCCKVRGLVQFSARRRRVPANRWPKTWTCPLCLGLCSSPARKTGSIRVIASAIGATGAAERQDVNSRGWTQRNPRNRNRAAHAA